MIEKSINIAPIEWQRLQPRSPWPSCIAVGALAVGLLIPTLGSHSSNIAEAAPRPPETVNSLEPWVRVEESSSLRASFDRLETWCPWDEVLIRIALEFSTGDNLQSCSFDGDQDKFEVVGIVHKISTVKTIVNALSHWDFLRAPEAFRVSPNGDRADFGVRFDVHPSIRRETP